MSRTERERARFLAAVADEHYRWVIACAADTSFRPEDHEGQPDYPLWHVDVEASGVDEDHLAAAIARRVGRQAE